MIDPLVTARSPFPSTAMLTGTGCGSGTERFADSDTLEIGRSYCETLPGPVVSTYRCCAAGAPAHGARVGVGRTVATEPPSPAQSTKNVSAATLYA